MVLTRYRGFCFARTREFGAMTPHVLPPAVGSIKVACIQMHGFGNSPPMSRTAWN